MEYQFETNINCGGCIATVTPFLNGSKDIQKWNVDTSNPAKILTIETESLSADQIKQIIERSGYKAEAIGA